MNLIMYVRGLLLAGAMQMLLVVGIIIVIVIITVVLIVGFIEHTHNKRKSIVLAYSKQIADVKKLNSQQYFFRFSNEIITKRCNSKKAFERVYFEDILKEEIENNLDYYATIIEKVVENKKNYNLYVKQYSQISSTISWEEIQSVKISLGKFREIERQLYDELQLKPQINVEICVKKLYSSPQGRNNYHDEITYNFNEWEYLYYMVREDKKRKETHAYKVQQERSKMTDSMRYDIMRRDKFRCVLCGAKAADGVQLHIDHIFPVSKGGKTEASNLRTLCSRCNLGKSDKIE